MGDRMDRYVEKMKKSDKKQISLWISKKALEKFNKYCQESGMNRSEAVEMLISDLFNSESVSGA